MRKRQNKQELELRVGIFWLYEGKLIIDSTPLSEAEPYGDSLGHATGHIDYWSALQERGVVPPDVEYEEPPRGRVGYDKREEQFFIRADNCILLRPELVERIMGKLNLPPDKTSVGGDEHYRCAKCLSRSRQEDDL
jgi:hypothetical protein